MQGSGMRQAFIDDPSASGRLFPAGGVPRLQRTTVRHHHSAAEAAAEEARLSYRSKRFDGEAITPESGLAGTFGIIVAPTDRRAGLGTIYA